MKIVNKIPLPTEFAWHTLLMTCLFVCLSLSAFEIQAKSNAAVEQFELASAGKSLLTRKIAGQNLNCVGDELCERINEICEDKEFCTELLQICQRFPDHCEAIFELYMHEEGDDSEGQECVEENEECEQGAESEGEECPEDDPECKEGGEQEGTEGEECEEGDPECKEAEEGEGEEQGEEGEEPAQCTDENGETILCADVKVNFNNPNPLADSTVIQVDAAAAKSASKFLSQATLGADYPTITQVASMGEAKWLESQFAQPTGYLLPFIEHLFKRTEELKSEDLLGSPVKFHMHSWWTQVMTSPDLVRQRVAMALSEIFVISSNVEVIGESPYAVSHYYDTLLTHSFGNFRDLLKDISLNPAMAIYLSHLNNEKADPARGTFPDENYAREVMQLFSIGLFELNPDGSRKKDSKGNDIPTYGQNEIREFAKIFTGLGIDIEGEFFGSTPCCNEDFYGHASQMKPLKMYDEFHSGGEKRLLNGVVVAAGQTGLQDIDSAIDNLFNHPNVGPFIGKQLIQRLVKSNPSPAYIARVTSAFNGENGTARGDMKAVVRAILLDPEARTIPTAAKAEGRLREPFLRLVRLSRMFNASTPERIHGEEGMEVAQRLKQNVLYAPSVFNFFQPGYAPNGEIKDAGLVAPEFQITNGVTIVEIKNLVSLWIETGRFEEPLGALPPETVSFETETAIADNPDALLDRLDTVMTYGTLTNNTRTVIKSVIESEPDMKERVKKAVFLIAISPDYAVAL